MTRDEFNSLLFGLLTRVETAEAQIRLIASELNAIVYALYNLYEADIEEEVENLEVVEDA